MATKKYLDYAGIKRVLAKLLPGARKIWHGTLAEWEALSAAEKAKYDQAEVIDEYTGVPVVVDKVESGNLNPVTSNAVAGKVPQNYKTTKIQPWTTAGDIDVAFTAPAGKKFIFGVGTAMDNLRAHVIVADDYPQISADGKTITIKLYAYSLGGSTPTDFATYLNALVVDE